MRSRSHLAVPLVIAALTTSACLSATSDTTDGQDGAAGRLKVVASFYPLQLATEQIGGSHIAVTTLTKPGAEPHDIELTPKDVARVSRARLVVFEKGLQGAVDKAVESEASDHSLDVSPAAKLDLTLVSGAKDPHFWLDPVRYSAVAKAISAQLSTVDPANKADYARNAKAFEAKLATLTRDFRAGLGGCKRKDLVTSHAAFGYLAQRFGMSQIAINGLTPDQEPKSTDLAAVTTYAKTHGVTTIYAETLVSPAIAATVARESGARMATLDPIEGLTSSSAGKDYFEVMRANLKALQSGQGCS